MSAYVVSDKSISTIVKTLVIAGTLQPVEAVSFGQMMLNLNTHSVNVRYQENNPAHPFEYSDPELNIHDPKTQMQVIVCIDEYEYQSCEFAEYYETMVHTVLKAIKSALMQAYTDTLPNPSKWKEKKSYDLPGYSEAEWGL
ncbi:TPA: hypothetical protein JZE05_004693 [Escherichia coli]|nr:hypothetical protein [Salmonella enterica subsp. enterica serovar Sandiego]EDC6358801.1 hypothetical protein [Salmonella enterica subsp. enterica serovar Braenderup]EDT4604572.1 hypothetical protein [Salmonella enterica subsp. enterica serovar Berta]HAX4116348.1 hypothetical protein [Escherichia coli]